MSPKATGILFLVAAALGAFVYFYEIRGEPGRREAAEATERLFAGFDADGVAEIALTSSDGVGVRAERRDGRWRIVEPLDFPADVYAFDAMAAALAQVTGETEIEDPREAAVYGLDADEREVRFRAGSEEERALRIGDKTPLGSNSYVAVAGEEGVYTVPTYRVGSFAKTFDDLREKRLLDFDSDGVDRLEASWPDGRVVLERSDAGWRLLEPVSGPADEELIDALLSDLAFLRATGFVDEPPPDEEAGLDRPAFAARLSGAASGEEGAPGERFEVALAIGSRPDGETRLARAAGPSLYRIPEGRLDDFPTDVVAYRFKQLARFPAADAQRLEILFHTALGESVALSLERGEDGWTSEPEPFVQGKAAALVNALANLSARNIAAESMGPEELAAVGLEPAHAVFRVFGKPPEGAGEAAPEPLAEVRLGVVRGSEGIVAQRAGADTVYVVDYELAEHLPVSYEAFGNRFRAEAEAAEAVEGEEPDAAPSAE